MVSVDGFADHSQARAGLDDDAEQIAALVEDPATREAKEYANRALDGDHGRHQEELAPHEEGHRHQMQPPHSEPEVAHGCSFADVKRSKALIPLSHDHQHGLAVALDLTRATAETAPAAVAAFAEFWRGLSVKTRQRLVLAVLGGIAVALFIFVAVPALPCQVPGGERPRRAELVERSLEHAPQADGEADGLHPPKRFGRASGVGTGRTPCRPHRSHPGERR